MLDIIRHSPLENIRKERDAENDEIMMLFSF